MRPAAASIWLALSWRSPREALLPAIGPLLGPLSLLGLLPLLVWNAQNGWASGDILGRDRTFAIGLAVYGVGSLTTALSPKTATR